MNERLVENFQSDIKPQTYHRELLKEYPHFLSRTKQKDEKSSFSVPSLINAGLMVAYPQILRKYVLIYGTDEHMPGFFEIKDAGDLVRKADERGILIPDAVRNSDANGKDLTSLFLPPDEINGIPVDAEELRETMRRTYIIRQNDKWDTWLHDETGSPMPLGTTKMCFQSGITDFENADMTDTLICRYNVLMIRRHAKEALLSHPVPKDWGRVFKTWLISKSGPNRTPLDIKNAELMIGHIERPSFERAPENKKRNTFDFIRIRMCMLSKELIPDLMGKVKRYQKELARIALDAIVKTKAWERYGLPENVLKITKMTVTSQREVECVFELKTTNEEKSEP